MIIGRIGRQTRILERFADREVVEALPGVVFDAQRAVDLVRTQYVSGLTNFQNVLDMQRSLFDQQDQLAAIDREIDVVDADRSVVVERAEAGERETFEAIDRSRLGASALPAHEVDLLGPGAGDVRGRDHAEDHPRPHLAADQALQRSARTMGEAVAGLHEVRGPLELLEDVEATLKIDCAPVTWPIGMGRHFRGVYHLLTDTVHLYTQGQGDRIPDDRRIEGRILVSTHRVMHPVEHELAIRPWRLRAADRAATFGQVRWQADGVASGVYAVRLETAGGVMTRLVTVVR